MTKQKIAVGYCRVSTEEQANKGLSLDVQKEACKNKIREDGFKLLKVIRDEGKSAGSLKRPGIEEIIKLTVGRKIDRIYTISSDRIARNTMDYLYLRDLFRKNDVELKYVYQANSDESAISRTMDEVMASFNQMQRLVISEKVRLTLYAKIEAGYWPTLAPLGYKNILNPDSTDRLSKKTIIPDPQMAPLITEAYKLYATGNYNAYDLNDLMYEKGLKTKEGKKMAPSRFYELLKNRVYIGEIHWGKVSNENAKHQALIDKETFNKVQLVMAGHNKHACRRRKYTWLLNGFIFCYKHQKRYTAEWHWPKKLAYYHCTNRFGCGKYVEVNKLENEIAEKFKEVEFDQEFIEKIIEKAKNIFYERRKEFDSKRQALINQRTGLEQKLQSATDKLLSGVLLDEEFTKTRNEIKKELDSIEGRLFNLNSKQELNIDITKEILRFTKDIHRTYIEASPTLKRHYLGFFWDRFEVADGVIIKSVPSLLFGELLKLEQIYLKNQNPRITGDFANSRAVINKVTWLRIVDNVRTIIQRQNEYIYIPDLRSYSSI